jgi:DNA-directed RNA polymerase sigma subunit (sigma70/sigma32)
MGAAQATDRVASAQSGDRKACDELISTHRRVVIKVANQYPQFLSLDERIRLGEQGLTIAIERFNPAKGFSFTTYATWWVRLAMTRGIGGEEEGAGVRVPWLPGPPSRSASATV